MYPFFGTVYVKSKTTFTSLYRVFRCVGVYLPLTRIRSNFPDQILFLQENYLNYQALTCFSRLGCLSKSTEKSLPHAWVVYFARLKCFVSYRLSPEKFDFHNDAVCLDVNYSRLLGLSNFHELSQLRAYHGHKYTSIVCFLNIRIVLKISFLVHWLVVFCSLSLLF